MPGPNELETQDRSDTSRFSYHVDDRFYERIADDSRYWAEPAPPAPPDLKAACEAFLVHEAWLLDEARFEDWLDLFTADCLYWIPITPGGGEPRGEVTQAFDDRRRLEDRVYWLRSGLVWSQIPPSRTRRLLSNIEVLGVGHDDEVRVRSNFVVHEMRPGRQRVLPGWYGHRLRRVDDAWKIVMKQVNLISSEQGHELMTIIL